MTRCFSENTVIVGTGKGVITLAGIRATARLETESAAPGLLRDIRRPRNPSLHSPVAFLNK